MHGSMNIKIMNLLLAMFVGITTERGRGGNAK
jgi:hypothetical protein